MNAQEFFEKLSKGAKFNFRRFQADAEKFQLIKPKERKNYNDIKIEFFQQEEKISKTSMKRKLREEQKDKTENEDENDFEFMAGMSASKNQPKKQKKELTKDKKLWIEKSKINEFRNQHKISVFGTGIPLYIQNFEELATKHQVPEDLLNNLKNCGYETPTPIQMQAIPTMLEKRQILAHAPTGSGKTAAFMLPIIHQLQGPQKKGFRAVVLSPTRELAKQTYRECLKLSEGRDFRIHIINNTKKALEKYGPTSSQSFDILITTPQRLEFLLKQDPPHITLQNVEWFVVDEADKLFEDTVRSFRDQLQIIVKACTNPDLKCAMFSATATHAVTKWCHKNMKRLITVTVGQKNSVPEHVRQSLKFVGNEKGKMFALRNMIQQGVTPPVLIFVQSKERAEELFNEIMYDGINVDVIHADKTQTQRDKIVRGFREGKIWVLICTELMSRGIDFKNVNLVINYDFPTSAISYIHRIGRTGRAGKPGKAVTFFTKEDTTNLRSIAALMKKSGCKNVPEYMLTMKKHDKRKAKKLKNSAPKRESIGKAPPKFRKPSKKIEKNDKKVPNKKTKSNKNEVSKLEKKQE